MDLLHNVVIGTTDHGMVVVKQSDDQQGAGIGDQRSECCLAGTGTHSPLCQPYLANPEGFVKSKLQRSSPGVPKNAQQMQQPEGSEILPKDVPDVRM